MKPYRLTAKWMLVSLMLIALCFILVPTTHAIEIVDKETVVIEAGEVIEDDLMVFANEFILNGTVKGDLILFVNTATLNGIVEGDLMGGGQEIFLNGTFADDVRLGGTVVTLGEAARIGDDLMAGGYSLESKAGSLVEGDFFLAVGQSRLAGNVAGDLWMTGGGLELLGEVAGNVQADVGAAEDAPVFSPFAFMPNAPNIPAFNWGLTVSDQAQIGGELSYTGPVAADIPAGVVFGEVTFAQAAVATPAEETTITPTQAAFNWLANLLRQLVVLLLIGVLMVWLAPRWTDKVAAYGQEKPLPSLGWGVLAIAVFVVAIVLTIVLMGLLVTAFGALTLDGLVGAVIMLGLFITFGLLLLFAFTVAYFTKIIVAVTGGRFIFNRFNSHLADSAYWSMMLGVLLIVILTAIPWIGSLIGLLVTLLGFGALWLEGRTGWQHRLAWWSEAPTAEVKVKPA